MATVKVFVRYRVGGATTKKLREQDRRKFDKIHFPERGGKNAKKRAVVAVARKLAVPLHRLWVSGEVYEPLRNSQKSDACRGLKFRSEQLSSTAESR